MNIKLEINKFFFSHKYTSRYVFISLTRLKLNNCVLQTTAHLLCCWADKMLLLLYSAATLAAVPSTVKWMAWQLDLQQALSWKKYTLTGIWESNFLVAQQLYISVCVFSSYFLLCPQNLQTNSQIKIIIIYKLICFDFISFHFKEHRV